MSSINSITDKSYSKTQQYDKKLKTSTDVGVKTLEIEYTKMYDLENITPKETYQLAAGLLENGDISLHDYAGLMAIGSSHEHPPGMKNMSMSNAKESSFNLLKELEAITEGTHDIFIYNHSKDTRNLLNLLLSLPEASLKIKYSSIDISV